MPNINFSTNIRSINSSITTLNQASQKLANFNENTDITNTIIEQKTAEASISLNIKSIKTKDETLGTLLDLIG